MKKTTRNVFDSVCGLAAVISIALLCCKCCDNQKLVEEKAAVESQLQEKKDSILVLQDSLKNVSARLTDCEKGKRCPVKKKPVKAPAKKPVKKPAPVVVKPDTIKPAPVVVKPDTVVVKPQVVIQDDANHNVVNINNGTVNNYYGETEKKNTAKKDTAAVCSCYIIIEETYTRIR